MTQTPEQIAEAIHRRLNEEERRRRAEEERIIQEVTADRLRREAAEAAAQAAADEEARPEKERRARLERIAGEFGPRGARAPVSTEERRELLDNLLRGQRPLW